MLYFLVGFMGAGKTTVGKLLAEKTGVKFIDSDREIEKRTGSSINQLFELHGETHFRKLELDFIENLVSSNAVISCGGGLPCYNSQMDRLLEKGSVIYLRAEIPVLLERLTNEIAGRPLLDSQDLENSIRQRLSEREPCYSKASLIVDTDNLTPEQIVANILKFRFVRNFK